MMAVNEGGISPIPTQRRFAQPYAFAPENLLPEVCGQKRIMRSRIPDVIFPYPDSDIVRCDGLRSRLLP
jgi:hypothetical protein